VSGFPGISDGKFSSGVLSGTNSTFSQTFSQANGYVKDSVIHYYDAFRPTTSFGEIVISP